MSSPAMKADPGVGREEDPIGSEGWAQRVRLHMQGIVNDVDTKPEALRRYVGLVQKHHAWTLMNKPDGSYFRTWEEFCEHRQPWGLGRPFAELKPYILAAHGGNTAVVAALTTRPEAAPKAGGKREGAGRPPAAHAASVALPIGPLLAVPTPPKSEAKPRRGIQTDHGKAESFGNNSAYLAARIARDAPAIHEEMKAGKYPSVRAAARAAGLVKVPDPVRVAATAFAKVPVHRLAEFVAAIPEEASRTLLTCLRDRHGRGAQ